MKFKDKNGWTWTMYLSPDSNRYYLQLKHIKTITTCWANTKEEVRKLALKKGMKEVKP